MQFRVPPKHLCLRVWSLFCAFQKQSVTSDSETLLLYKELKRFDSGSFLSFFFFIIISHFLKQYYC